MTIGVTYISEYVGNRTYGFQLALINCTENNSVV